MANTLLSRKRDLCYLVFFIIHIPIMLIVDLTPLYPQSVHAQFTFLATLRNWYISTYRDRLFTHPPAWFQLYTWMEALYHLPTSMWAIPALLADDPRVPLVLLIFAAQTAMTTATCLAEFLSWKGVSIEDKKGLAGLYVPYLVLALLMLADMYGRLDRKLTDVTIQKRKKI